MDSSFGNGVPKRRDRKSTRLNSSHANISYAVFCLIRLLPCSTSFPYTTLFRSVIVWDLQRQYAQDLIRGGHKLCAEHHLLISPDVRAGWNVPVMAEHVVDNHGLVVWERRAETTRSEEHTSELQSRQYLVCRLLLDPPSTLFYIFSLHDALPICNCLGSPTAVRPGLDTRRPQAVRRTSPVDQSRCSCWLECSCNGRARS